jgi:hypothetical protein
MLKDKNLQDILRLKDIIRPTLGSSLDNAIRPLGRGLLRPDGLSAKTGDRSEMGN